MNYTIVNVLYNKVLYVYASLVVLYCIVDTINTNIYIHLSLVNMFIRHCSGVCSSSEKLLSSFDLLPLSYQEKHMQPLLTPFQLIINHHCKSSV